MKIRCVCFHSRHLSVLTNNPSNLVLFIPKNAESVHGSISKPRQPHDKYHVSPYIPSPEFTSRDIELLDIFVGAFLPSHTCVPLTSMSPSRVQRRQPWMQNKSMRPAPYPIYTPIPKRYIYHRHGPFNSIVIYPPTYKHFCRHHHVDSPPARFDRRIAAIYEHYWGALITADAPILLLCGGATGLMVPGTLLPSSSKACALQSRHCIVRNTCATAIAITSRKP